MAMDSLAEWKAFEEQTAQRVFLPTGMLLMGRMRMHSAAG